MANLLSESNRAYFYRVSLAVMPLLTFYGVIEENAVTLWSGLVLAIVNIGLATGNTSTKKPEDEVEVLDGDDFFPDEEV